MARMGVFSRNDSTPDSVPRSLQLLSHRHSFTTQYMRIVPNFAEILYPNESISLQVTNFVRTIPMQKPMLSRIRVVQRFCAVPLRILWQQWEDYIKGENEAQFLLDEPYIVNATNGTALISVPGTSSKYAVDMTLQNNVNNHIGHFTDDKIVYRNFYPSSARPPIPAAADTLNPRGITLTEDSYVPTSFSTNPSDDTFAYAEFAPRELGDLFGAPTFAVMGKATLNGAVVQNSFSAFKFAAYQLAYSYFDRQPNVQTRIDDFYEISAVGRAARGLPQTTTEFAPYLGLGTFSNNVFDRFVNVVNQSGKLRYGSSSSLNVFNWNYSDSVIGIKATSASLTKSIRDIAANIDPSSQTYQQDVIRSSWENVEKFPLKSGANLSMLAWYNDSSTGIPAAVPSNISLSRIRYANWQTDYFTSCNPWQQRGDEAQIPVSGTVSVSLDDLTITGNANVPGSSVVVNSLPIQWKSSNTVYGDVDGTAPSDSLNSPLYLPYDTDSPGPNLESGSAAFVTNADMVGLYNKTQTVIVPGHTAPVTGTVSGSSSVSVSGLYVSPSNFRFAMTLQHIKEMQAQIDNRYQSYIHKFFGARARDYRLDRPEFIGGSVFELNVSDVTQTSETTESSNLADVAGKSVTADTSRTIRYHADEHCVILGTLHIIPDTEYISGLSRVDSTKDRFDWVLPQFGHLSEQPVYNSELVYHGLFSSDDNDEVFGYEPIYNNLRWRKNFATCDFRDVFNFTGNELEYKPWLQVKDYGNLIAYPSAGLFKTGFVKPTLSDQFLSGRYNRDNSNFVVTDDNLVFPFMVDSYFKQRMVRIIPSRGTPTRLGA